LRTSGNHWSIWIDWYDDILAGAIADKAWDSMFTDIPGKLPWARGAKAVNIEIARRLAKLRDSELSEIPDQSPAPVRVEERAGRVSKATDRDSALNASERDFRAWRDPVVDHIDELTGSDFALGTNHGRIRDRLMALGKLLPGEIIEVKERQFRIGYEIERFEGLMAAYRTGGEDMPALNAAQLEDIDRLRVALKMGIDKLERWSEFRRLASEKPSATHWTKWPLSWNSTPNILIRSCRRHFGSYQKPCAIRGGRPGPSCMERSKARKMSSVFSGNGLLELARKARKPLRRISRKPLPQRLSQVLAGPRSDFQAHSRKDGHG
jgi:hypothetical protein